MSNWAGVVARVNPTKTGRCSRGTSGLSALGFRQRACTAQRHNIHVAPGGGFGVLHITRGYAAAVQQQQYEADRGGTNWDEDWDGESDGGSVVILG